MCTSWYVNIEKKSWNGKEENIPVDVMTGLIFACLERASMHSSFDMWKIKHFSIRCCTWFRTNMPPRSCMCIWSTQKMKIKDRSGG